MGKVRSAEFFAGIGLMRLGLESAGVDTVWANDIEAAKREMYVENFGDSEFHLNDVRNVLGGSVPDIDLATASFPCTDLSLAGLRRGLGEVGEQRDGDGGSSMFWEFARVIDEMDERRPPAVLLENVLGFATSHGGADLRAAVFELNRLGYSCDLVAIDARHFVPQSRPRMFIVGLASPPDTGDAVAADRPEWVKRFFDDNPNARLHSFELPPLPNGPTDLSNVVERLPDSAAEWWDGERLANFVASLSDVQSARLAEMKSARSRTWRTAYRRTRNGSAVWEMRADTIAGCLRTSRGGSSKQAVVEAGNGVVRVRWMTPREYARLMGAPDFSLPKNRNRSLFGFGDAVCVPVISWLCEHYVCSVLSTEPMAVAA